jgi:hypothetical protein
VCQDKTRQLHLARAARQVYIGNTRAIRRLALQSNWNRTITQESEVVPMKRRATSWKSWMVDQGLTRFEQDLPAGDISEIKGDLIMGILRAVLVSLTPLMALYLSKKEFVSKGFDRVLSLIDKETENRLDAHQKRRIIYNILLFVLNLQVFTVTRFLGRRIFQIESESASSDEG